MERHKQGKPKNAGPPPARDATWSAHIMTAGEHVIRALDGAEEALEDGIYRLGVYGRDRWRA